MCETSLLMCRATSRPKDTHHPGPSGHPSSTRRGREGSQRFGPLLLDEEGKRTVAALRPPLLDEEGKRTVAPMRAKRYSPPLTRRGGGEAAGAVWGSCYACGVLVAGRATPALRATPPRRGAEEKGRGAQRVHRRAFTGQPVSIAGLPHKNNAITSSFLPYVRWAVVGFSRNPNHARSFDT